LSLGRIRVRRHLCILINNAASIARIITSAVKVAALLVSLSFVNIPQTNSPAEEAAGRSRSHEAFVLRNQYTKLLWWIRRITPMNLNYSPNVLASAK
jgi:hypothetical protein